MRACALSVPPCCTMSSLTKLECTAKRTLTPERCHPCVGIGWILACSSLAALMATCACGIRTAFAKCSRSTKTRKWVLSPCHHALAPTPLQWVRGVVLLLCWNVCFLSELVTHWDWTVATVATVGLADGRIHLLDLRSAGATFLQRSGEPVLSAAWSPRCVLVWCGKRPRFAVLMSMHVVPWLAGWLVGWLGGWLVGWLVQG